MRVVDVEGKFVGFVKEVVGENLVIVRPMEADVRVSMADCRMSSELIELNLSADEIAKMGGHNAGGFGLR